MNHHIVIEQRTNRAATISLLCALFGFLFSLIPLFGWFSMPLWILAILFGIVGMFKLYKRTMAIAGIIIGMSTFFYKIAFLQILFW